MIIGSLVLMNQRILDSFQVSVSCTRAPSTCRNLQTGLQTRYWSSLIPSLKRILFFRTALLGTVAHSYIAMVPQSILPESSGPQSDHIGNGDFKCNANLMPSLNLNKAHQHAQGNPLTHPAFKDLWPIGTNPYSIEYKGHIYNPTSDWLGWVRVNFRMGVESVYQCKFQVHTRWTSASESQSIC